MCSRVANNIYRFESMDHKCQLQNSPIFQVFQVLHKPSGNENRSKEKSMKTTHILILNRSSKRNDLETTKILKYNKKTWFHVIVVTLKTLPRELAFYILLYIKYRKANKEHLVNLLLFSLISPVGHSFVRWIRIVFWLYSSSDVSSISKIQTNIMHLLIHLSHLRRQCFLWILR